MKKVTKATAKETPTKNKKSTSIRKAIIDLMTSKGVDNVTKEEADKLAHSIKKDTAWSETHFYYYRKIVKKLTAPKETKKAKAKEK